MTDRVFEEWKCKWFILGIKVEGVCEKRISIINPKMVIVYSV